MNTAIRAMILPMLMATASFVVTACDNKPGEAKEPALKASKMFHRQFNDPQERDLLVVHAASGHPEFVGYLHSSHVREAKARLGLFERASVMSCKISSTPVGTNVFLKLNSQFEHGEATERISVVVAGTSTFLGGYTVESPLLHAQ